MRRREGVTPNAAASSASTPSCDLRWQILATLALLPRRLRDSSIAAVVFTGTEVDQGAGLLTLRERGAVDNCDFGNHDAMNDNGGTNGHGGQQRCRIRSACSPS